MKRVLLFLFITISTNAQTDSKSKWDKYIVSDDSKVTHSSRAKFCLWKAEKACNSLDADESDTVQWRSALTWFNMAITEGFEDAYIYYEKGYCESVLQEFPNAIQSLTKSKQLLKPVPQYLKTSLTFDPGILFYREDYFDTLSDDTLSEKSMPVEVIFNHKPKDIFYRRGWCKIQMDDYRGALSDLNSITSKIPYYFYLKGLCKYKLDDLAGAKIELSQSIKLDDKYCESYYLRGGCNYNIGLKNAACLDWSKAGELGCNAAYESIKDYCQ